MGEMENRVLRAALCMTRQCWEQGMLAYSLLRSIAPVETDLQREREPEGELWEILKMIVYDMVLRQSGDGRLCNVEDTPAVTDSAFCIPAVLAVGEALGNETFNGQAFNAPSGLSSLEGCGNKSGNSADSVRGTGLPADEAMAKDTFIRAAQKNAEYLLKDAPRTEDGILYHMRGTTQIWADSAAFLPYALVITGHPKEGYQQMIGILGRLYLRESGLYAHIWDEESRSYPDRNAWSIGVGWILTGLERTWRVLPDEMERERADLKERFVSLMERVLPYQCEDGGFHDVMDDPSTYMETEAPAMIACAIYAGIRDGILDDETDEADNGELPEKSVNRGYGILDDETDETDKIDGTGETTGKERSCQQIPAADRGNRRTLHLDELLDQADAMTAYVENKILPDGRVTDAAASPAFDRPGTSVECQAHAWVLPLLSYR